MKVPKVQHLFHHPLIMTSEFQLRLDTINKKRFKEGKQRKRASNLSKQQRRAQLALNEHKRRLVYADIQSEWARQKQVIHKLSEKHNVSIPEMKRRLQRLPKYGQQSRKVNPWNAVQHVLSLEINEGLYDSHKILAVY